MKKYVLIVSPSDKLGGAEQFLLNIASEYLNRGYIVDVFFLLAKSNDYWTNVQGLNIFYTNSKKESKGLFWFILNFIRKGRIYDLTFSSHQHINGLLSLLKKNRILKTEKLIVRESTSVFLRYKFPRLYYYKLIYMFYFRKEIDLIICQSLKMKEQLINGNNKFKRFNVEVITNPVNLKTIYSKSKESLHIDYPFILAIGRLHAVKGFDNLIKAYKLSHAFPKYRLVILGEGSEREKLEALINNLELNNHVKLYGHIENVYPFIKHASLGVISSFVEGFPNVLVQMTALNLKVVSSKCCGGLDDFPNIYLANNNTPDNIAQQLNLALNNTAVINCENFISNFDLELFPSKIDILV